MLQMSYKAMCICKLCRRNHFCIRSIRLTISNIIPYCSGKQMRILQNDAQRLSQIILLDQLDINAIIRDRPLLYIIESVDQIGNCGFSCTCSTDKCHLLTTLSIQLDVIQNLLILMIAKIHIIKNDISNQRNILHSTISSRMPPRPFSCRLLTLNQLTVNLLHMCKRHQAIIRLQVFIHQCKDAGSTCGCHNNGI